MDFPENHLRFLLFWACLMVPAFTVALLFGPLWVRAGVAVVCLALLAGGLQTVADRQWERDQEGR